MMNQSKIPNAEVRLHSATKMRDLCKRIDTNLLDLDELISQLETDIRKSSLTAYRLGKSQKTIK